ncbi:MAG: beta-ketoacyl-[acyl-carrier-protein] synthase family protein [Candidatus Brocadiae bacterium]|nr:beta-ketoacyl-[acyl-carrier-protein] synthase family protein [Candidatus Brocadiia bacterium]
MERKVVVTGLYMMNSLGMDIKTSWENIVAGKSGIRNITLFDTTQFATKIAGEVPGDVEEYIKKYCKKHTIKQMARGTKMCFMTAKEAVKDSGVDFEKLDKERCSVVLGVIGTGFSKIYEEKDPSNRILRTMDNAMPAWISLEYKLEGPNFTIATACSSASYAMSYGFDLIRSNRADVVVTGGASANITPEEIGGFNEVYALSTANAVPEKASKPFSKDRDGFVMSEGAGILVLEAEEVAKARGAKIYAELIGYGLSSEAYNIMAPMKDGYGMAKTMEMAIKHAKINKEQVDYINAHGTSTQLNDLYETMAIKKVFGEQAYKIPISGSKSMIGHTLAAAGAMGSVITVLSIHNKTITPTINYDPDPELNLDYIPNQSREKDVKIALVNSYAFGGHNATMVFKKYE